MRLALSKLFTLLFALTAPHGFGGAVHAARAALARAGVGLWGVRLDTLEWLGVDGQRIYCTRRPDTTGFVLTSDSLWVGPLPAGLTPANTSIDRFGRRWAMVILPLPSDLVAAERLLIHESMHVLQPSVLPLPKYVDGNPEYLDGPIGRFWLKLEIAALADALDGKDAIADALIFRERRLGLTSADERRRELGLELIEGLPEYTAWRLTDSSGRGLAKVLRTPEAPQQSYVRRFPYLTGPAYAMLLDRVSPEWRRRLTDTADLGQMLLDAAIAKRYGAAEIASSEQARWEKRRAELEALTARFVNGSTVRIRPSKMTIAFDPRSQAPLGANGTVMYNVHWRADDGAELVAPDGALVTQDWRELRVPLDSATFTPGRLTAVRRWQTAGWTLTLPKGWNVSGDSASWIIAPDTVTPH
jgi:hypothetical protein